MTQGMGLWRWSVAACALTACGCSIDRMRTWFTGSDAEARIAADPVTTRDVNWRGWPAIEQTNGLLTLRTVPAAGGRTLSLEIGGDDAFLVFPDQQGKTYPADSREKVVHFGGHYTAIGPERTWNVEEQPFNPLSGPYQAERRTDSSDAHELRMTSRAGRAKGAMVAMARSLTLARGHTHVVVDETLINRGSAPLDIQAWDFTQIDAVNHFKPDRPLRRISVYLPTPRYDGRKRYHVFGWGDKAAHAQFDESLPTDVLAIHYTGATFKISSHPSMWWIATVDHDSGWTYIKAFDAQTGARYPENEGPVEVYGSAWDRARGWAFLEMELLTGLARLAPGAALQQREHWYATVCKGPVLAFTPVGVVCQPLQAARDGAYFDVSGRFGVFYLGAAAFRVLGEGDAVLFESEPVPIDPRREFLASTTLPSGEGARRISLVVYDHRRRPVSELASVPIR